MHTWRIGKDALRVAGLVLKAGQHPVQPIMAQLLQEPLYVGARQASHCIEAQTRVLYHHCSTHLQSIAPLLSVSISALTGWHADCAEKRIH